MASASMVRRRIQVSLNTTLSPAARSKHLAAFARRELRNLIQSGRASDAYTRVVDGRRDVSEDAVRGDGRGVITYYFSYTTEATMFAIAYLQRRSPVRSGRFRRGFIVSVNGRMIPAGSFNPRSAPSDAEIIITNTEPYNRKVDVQQVGGRTLHFNVPPKMYEDCARAVNRRFGNTIRATRYYDIDFSGKYRLRARQVRKSGRYAGRVVRAKGDYVQSPGLIIAIRK